MSQWYNVVLGFSLNISGFSGNFITVGTDGSIYNQGQGLFTFVGTDLDHGQRSYSVDGTTGNHVFKLQYKNMNFLHGWANADVIDFQTWFYEADGTIEVHMGNSTITDALADFNSTPFCFWGERLTFQYNYLPGNINNPVLILPATCLRCRLWVQFLNSHIRAPAFL